MGTKYFCDKCGKEIETDSDTFFSSHIDETFKRGDIDLGISPMLCKECKAEFKKIIKKFLNH